MKHEVQARYPATPAVLLAMFTDRAFHERRLDALGVSDYRVLEHAADAREFRIRIERLVPVNVPAMLKKLVPVTPKIVSMETWTLATKTGHIEVDAQGMPVDMSCALTLAAEGRQNCVVTYAWTVRAKVPLMGGMVEKFVAADIDKRAAEELQAALKLLDAYRP